MVTHLLRFLTKHFFPSSALRPLGASLIRQKPIFRALLKTGGNEIRETRLKMDIKDVSGIDRYREMLEQFKRNATRASLRKGENPQDHPPPQLLIAQFMRGLVEADSRSKHGHYILTSQVPPNYPPCVLPIKELAPLMISRMTLEHHHRGNRALVHVLTPPDRMTSVMAIAEDEEGTAVLLQLYNQPDECDVSKEQVLQKGDVCIVKEPFFKTTVSGSYSLRVDHISDIIWLEDTNDNIPLKWRKRVLCLDEDSQDVRKLGNVAVQKRNWAEAERLYTQAIRTATTPEEGQLAHLNRSLANLRLNRPQRALNDALKGSANENFPTEKALFRQAKAFYALGKFKPCLEKLLALVRDNPKNTDAWAEIKRTKQRLSEEETGSYQFDSMYKQAKATPPLIDCATYMEPVSVRDSAGRGKGLFTTRPVKAGDLLFCEKAFAYSYAGEDNSTGRSNMTVLVNLSTESICIGGQAQLIKQVTQKLYHNSAGAEVFNGLHHGGYNPVKTCEVDGAPVVDTFLAAKIIQLNCFGAPRSSYDFSMNETDENGSEMPTVHTTCGVWPLASRINHSCINNCHRSFIGDVQILRACQDMEADTELYFWYQPPLPHQTYEETQKNLKPWGFICCCALCLGKKTTSQDTIQQRKNLISSLESMLRPGASMMQLLRSGNILQDVEKTYPAGENASLVPRLELWIPYFTLGERLLTKSPADGLEMLLKGLEALGFSLIASPPRDVADEENGGKPVLEIKRWGQTSDSVPFVFLLIMKAYQQLAPELCVVAEEYAGVAYSIRYGEKETIGTLCRRVM